LLNPYMPFFKVPNWNLKLLLFFVSSLFQTSRMDTIEKIVKGYDVASIFVELVHFSY